MSTEEQDQIRGRALREKEDLERALRCWRDKALRMGRNLVPVDTTLRNMGHEGIPIEISDGLIESLKTYPTKEEVETTLHEVQRLSEEIQRLEKVIAWG